MRHKTPQKRVLFVRGLKPLVVGLLSVFLFSVVIFFVSPKTQAATDSTVNFQARLMSGAGSIVGDGNYNIEFKLYSASSGGSALWTETYYDSNGTSPGNDNRVRVVNGYLTVSLGSLTAFPTTINWDQDLYITMNVGGTNQTATPTWDGEMSPRLHLTAVPYAFRAGQLAQFNGTTGFTSTLNLVQPTGGNQIFSIPDQGAAGTYTLLTTTSASGSFIQLQGSTPGTAQTGNFNISGTGIVGTALQAPLLDTTTGALNIGTTNATAINLNQNTTLASGKTLNVNGAVTIQNSTDSFAELWVKNAASKTVFNVDSSSTEIVIGAPGNSLAGTILLADGSAAFGQGVYLSTNGPLTASRTIYFPDAAGTLCLQGSTSCNFAPTTGGTGYIQNQNASDQTANFRISGVGRANTAIATPALRPVTDGTSGLQIQNAAGSTTVMTIDTTNARVAIGASVPALRFEVQNGDAAVYNNGSNARLVLGDNSTTGQYGWLQWDSANDYFRIETAGSNGLKIKDNDVTIGNIFPDQPLKVANGSTLLFQINSTGSAFFQNSTNSSTAFQVQNTASSNLLNIDTTVANILTNSNFEGSTTGWSPRGSSVLTQTSSQSVFGSSSLQIATTAALNDGAKYTYSTGTLTSGSTYALSFYAKISSGTFTVQAGRADNGSTETTCTLSSSTVSTSWTRFTCTFTAGSQSGTPYIFIRQSDSTSRTFFVDGVMLEAGSTINAYREGLITLDGTLQVTSNTLVQGDSIGALKVQDGTGTNTTLAVDTINTRVGIGTASPSARLDVEGSTSLFQNTAQTNTTSGTVTVNTTATPTAGGTQRGIKNTLTNSPTTTANTAILQDLSISDSTTLANTIEGQNLAVTNSGAVASGIKGLQGMNITVSDTGSGTSTVRGLLVDTSGTTNGSATITGALIKSSGSALVVQDASAKALLTADGTNDLVQVGSASADGSAILLVLDGLASSTEPSTSSPDGSMYYNSVFREFRCLRDSVWDFCGINPIDRGYEIDDEFLGGVVAPGGTVGSQGWFGIVVTGGSACTPAEFNGGSVLPSADHPGIFHMSPAAGTLNTGCTFALDGGNTATGSMTLAAGQVIKTSVAIGATGASSQVMRVGIYDETTSTTAPATGVWVEADPSQASFWRYCFNDSSLGVRCASSSVSLVANSLTSIVIRINSLGSGTSSVDFIINGSSNGTTGFSVNTTNRVSPAFTCYTLNTSAKHCYIDYYQLSGVASARR